VKSEQDAAKGTDKAQSNGSGGQKEGEG
jgi:hypothetical protein